MVRIVYDDFRLFYDNDSLKDAITNAWDSIDIRLLEAIVRSMPRRRISLIEKRGPMQSTECMSL